MRIAQNDPRAHPNQFVHEKHARFEHLLMHQDQTLTLGRRHDGDRHEIGGERRPRLIFELWDMASQVAPDLPALLSGDDEVIAVDHAFDAETGKAHAYGSEVFHAGIGDAELGARDRREADKRTDFDVIRSYGI